MLEKRKIQQGKQDKQYLDQTQTSCRKMSDCPKSVPFSFLVSTTVSVSVDFVILVNNCSLLLLLPSPTAD